MKPMRIWQAGAFACLVYLQMGLVRATGTEEIVKADNQADFSALVVSVQKEMNPGGRYGYVDSQEREHVNAGLTYMQSLFDRYKTVDAMPQDSKIDLFNHQEAVNAILTRRDNDRVVCEKIAPVGSHIQRTTCRTYGLIEQERRDAQNAMQDFKAQRKFKGTH